MRLLLDTHVVLWWFEDAPDLGASARRHIADPQNAVFVSAVTFAEVSIKQALGKLDAPRLSDDLIAEQGMSSLALSPAHGRRVGELPLHHRDPFDRLLIAQAMEEGLTVVTADGRFADYGVPIVAAGSREPAAGTNRL